MHKKKNFLVALCLSVFLVNSYAISGDFSDYANFANNSEKSSTQKMANFDPTQFKNYTSNPEQTKYYQGGVSDNAIKNDTSNALSQSAGGQTIENTFSQDHQIKVNKESSEIQRSQVMEQDSYNVTHGVSDQYVTCNKDDQSKDFCGRHSFCMDGSCYQPKSTQNQNFGKDEAEIAAVSNGANSISNNMQNFSAFSGSGMSCSLAPIGFLNCCANHGWGKDIGLANCSNEEKTLGQDRQNGYAIYVGKYCSHHFLGFCTEHRESYCVFNGLLAKDVQDQGRRGQLNIGFGSAKYPDCSGLSVLQLQRINFRKIDFSNLEQSLENQSNFPSNESIQQYIANKIKQEMGNK